MDAPPQAYGPPVRLPNPRSGPSDPFDLLGDVLDGQFRVDSFAGEGELSVVYKGHHLGVDAPVAIKCLNLPETLHPALARPLEQGFKEASRLHYRLARGNLHIAQAIASGSTLAPRTGASIPYLVREWFHGESLASDLSRRRKESREGRPIEETLALLEPAFDAMSYAHGQGAVHLALNPTNLFLAHNEEVASAPTLKVLDFGVAGTIGAIGSEAPPAPPSSCGLRLLVPAYAAPEQLERTVGRLGPWSDVYALALVMLEVLSDRIVMSESETGALVERAIDERRRPTPQSLGLRLPGYVDRALSRAVARAPEARQSSAAELWREVSRPTNAMSLPWREQAPRPSALKPPVRVAVEARASTGPVPVSPTLPVLAIATLGPGVELASEAVRADPSPIPQAGPAAAPVQPHDEGTTPVSSWSEFLGLLVSCMRAVVTEVVALCALKVRHLFPPRVRNALFVGAAFTFLLPAALSWRRGSSPVPAIAASSERSPLVSPPEPSPSIPPIEHNAEPPGTVLASSAPFSRGSVLRALDRKWREVAKCRRTKAWGKASTTITFATDGSVSDVAVGLPFLGTPTAECIAGTLASVRVEPFDNGPTTIDYRVYIAPR